MSDIKIHEKIFLSIFIFFIFISYIVGFMFSENSAGGAIRGAMLCHKDTMVLAEQQGIRSQTQYKQEFLGTLYTADRLYGTQVLRPETGFIMAVNG